MTDKKEYTKWEPAEPASIAYAKVKEGSWDLARFMEWNRHVIVTTVRAAMENEDI